ncbi:sigma-70 family RNA polymerase sigma factor [Cytobacillus sp.]|uniref:sigma-70 family RNA polymerase sigma factor n=1 Tax=Cytobacillus sp. TaxID=2675269 RepID=UPI0028BE95A6|nr:sigma-70 family RNA polymerase sigma factor [Cytobacillus sp.]
MNAVEIVPIVDLEQIVKENEKLVHYVARRFLKYANNLRIEYDDLVSEGMIGLIKAVRNFDPSYGVKFSTYAVPMIKGNIQRLLRDINPGPKFSRTVKEIAMKITGDESFEEIAVQFEVTFDIAKEVLALKKNRYTTSLDQPMGNDGEKDLTVADTIPIEQDTSELYVKEFLQVLDDEKLKTIVQGILSSKTQVEIANEIGCSQVHISRLLKKIREKYLAYERGELTVTKSVKIMKSTYEDLKDKGYSDRLIAEKLGVSTATLYNHKLNWNTAPKQLDKAEKKASRTKPSKEDQNAEYRQLIDELSTALNDEKKSGKEKDVLIEKLEAKVSELESIHAACDDIESELTSLKEERDNYRDQLLNTRHELTQLDYSYENIKKENEKMIKSMALYETENMAMRELLRLWI